MREGALGFSVWCLILRHHLYSVLPFLLEEWKPSLFGSPYLGHNGSQADFEKLETTSKQKAIYQIPRGWDKIV